jgi:16S rRNA (guanine527-N7)-methyltransferase
MDNCRAILVAGIAELGFVEDNLKLEKLLAFITLMMKWNKTYNLTAIRDPEQMAQWHILDSLAINPYLHGQRFLDIGTGAGLPGIPLAIFNPKKQFVLLDSNAKKTRFVQQAMVELKLDNIRIHHTRVENFTPKFLFDTVMCRAFSRMESIIALSTPLLTKSGIILAMKGKSSTEKLANNSHIIHLNVPFIDAERCLICVPSPSIP